MLDYAEHHHGLVTRAFLVSHGWSAAALTRQVNRGALERTHQGVYRLPGSPRTFPQAVMSATLAVPHLVASHGTAATLLGLPQGHERLEFSLVGLHRVAMAQARIHRVASLEPVDRSRVRGIPTTSVTRTVIDLAQGLDREEQVALTDHVLAERRTRLAFLITRARALGTRGRSRAGEYLALLHSYEGLDRVVDSEAQRLLSRIIAQYGLEAPEVEYEIELDNGEVRYADAAWPRYRLLAEVQSFRHHAGMEDFDRDQTRNNWLVVGGWRILSLTPHAIRTDPAEVARVIGQAIQAARDQAGSAARNSLSPAR